MNRGVSPNSSAALKQLSQNQHTSSPTPTLAFTPTSVLRKMTAEKDCDSSTNSNNAGNVNSKDLNKVRYQFVERHLLEIFAKKLSDRFIFSNSNNRCSSNNNNNNRTTFFVCSQMFPPKGCKDCHCTNFKQCKESACRECRKTSFYPSNQIIHSKFWRNKKVCDTHISQTKANFAKKNKFHKQKNILKKFND